MKILGAIIIICVCWFLGVDFYKTNTKKLEFAKGIYDGINFLKSEIKYSCDFLSNSILKAAMFSGIASEFMENAGKALVAKGVSTENAFNKAGTFIIKNTDNETYILTKNLFLQLGEKDCENQEKIIEGYLEKLAVIINKQEKFCQKECVMFKKTGAIVGIGIAVLLI